MKQTATGSQHDPWNPRRYERFREERLRAFDDLLALVEPRDGMRVADERRLDPGTFDRFLARYRERLLAALAGERPFVYTFRRLFLWGRR